MIFCQIGRSGSHDFKPLVILRLKVFSELLSHFATPEMQFLETPPTADHLQYGRHLPTTSVQSLAIPSTWSVAVI